MKHCLFSNGAGGVQWDGLVVAKFWCLFILLLLASVPFGGLCMCMDGFPYIFFSRSSLVSHGYV